MLEDLFSDVMLTKSSFSTWECPDLQPTLYLGAKCNYYRKRDPLQSPRMVSCPTFGNELLEETHKLTKQEILLGRRAVVESSRVGEPWTSALPHGSVLGFCGDAISFLVVFGQSF